MKGKDGGALHIVDRFNEDVRTMGGYAYTMDKLSTKLANSRMTRAIAENFSLVGKKVLDMGCGDGSYSIELARLGATSVLGVEPAAQAVDIARDKVDQQGLGERVQFMVGDVYSTEPTELFDCVVLRGVLHHLPDPAAAVTRAAKWSNTVLILEPNGLNPVLKIIEKVSRYHQEHGERSFFPWTLAHWCQEAGLCVNNISFINLVPMFSSDVVAQMLQTIGPIVEKIPVLRNVCCGQVVLVASR